MTVERGWIAGVMGAQGPQGPTGPAGMDARFFSATVAIATGIVGLGGTRDIDIPISPVRLDTTYNCVPFINAPASILGNLIPRVQAKALDKVTIRVTNTAAATLGVTAELIVQVHGG